MQTLHPDSTNPPIWLLFDDAQDTYWDEYLWNTFFKYVVLRQGSGKVFVVCFSSHGGVSDHSQYSNLNQVIGTPTGIPPAAHMGYTARPPINHGLLFDRTEYDGFIELVRTGVVPGRGLDWPMVDDYLKDWIFISSQGHIGAIYALFGMTSGLAVCDLLLFVRTWLMLDALENQRYSHEEFARFLVI